MVSLSQMPRLVSLILLATIIVVLGLTFYKVVAPFLMPLFLAGVVALLFQPVFHRVLTWLPGRPGLAAGLTTTLVLVIIMVPLSLGTISAANQLFATQNNWAGLLKKLAQSDTTHNLKEKYTEWTGAEVDLDELVKTVELRSREAATNLDR